MIRGELDAARAAGGSASAGANNRAFSRPAADTPTRITSLTIGRRPSQHPAVRTGVLPGICLMLPPTDDRRWLLRPDVVSTIMNEGAVILDLRTKFFFTANPTAWAVAQMFEFGATRAEILAASKHWGADANAAPSLNALMDQMIAEGLIEPAQGPPSAPASVTVGAWIPPTLSKHHEPLQRIMVSAFDPGMPLAE
jgi:hypothetical protein